MTTSTSTSSKDLLGQTVKCRVTGYQGMVTSQTRYLEGCDRLHVQAPMTDGKVPEPMHLDILSVDVVPNGPVYQPPIPQAFPGG